MSALQLESSRKQLIPRASRPTMYHWQQCLGYFSKSLTLRLEGRTADAMLVTSTLINGLGFALVQASAPEHSWPLRSNDDDLQWLSLQGGINLVFGAVQPLGEDSALGRLFAQAVDEDAADGLVAPECPQFIALSILCDMATSPTAPTNPYVSALLLLQPLLLLPCNATTLLAHLSFIGNISRSFISLLRAKDHRALLIFACWYAGICEYDCWWTLQRSRIEGTAIIIFLERNGNADIREVLEWPARKLGYALNSDKPRVDDASTAQTLIPCSPM